MDKSAFDSTKIDALGEIHNITMGSAAVAVSNIIDSAVWITTPQVDICKAGEITPEQIKESSAEESFSGKEKYVYVKINYIKGVTGTSLLVLHTDDVQMIVKKMMGMPMEVEENFEFDEIKMSAICEVMNQMMGASATSLSQLLNVSVDISPPEAEVSSDARTLLKMQNLSADDDVCSITFELTIDKIIKSKFITMLSLELANDMASKLYDVNMGGSPEELSSEKKPEEIITPAKTDAIGELENITMGSAATALSKLLDSKVWITTPQVNIAKAHDVTFEELEPSVCVKIKYIKGIYGTSVLVLKQSDVQMMINKIMGMPPVATDDFVFDEMAMSAVCEIMNQMMGASATTLSEIICTPVDISTPETMTMSSDNDICNFNNLNSDDDVCVVSFDLSIDGIMNSRFVTMLSIDLADEMAGKMLENYSSALDSYSEENNTQLNKTTEPMSPSEVLYEKPVQEPAKPVQEPPKPAPNLKKEVPKASVSNNVKVQEYQMASFEDEPNPTQLTQKQYNNLLSLMNVPMDVTIRIGSTQKRMDEVLDFSKGTIIELDALADEPVDVVVNGNLIARGDVVVVDDNFAIRITEIIKSNLLDTFS